MSAAGHPRRFAVRAAITLGLLAAPIAAYAQTSPSAFTSGERYDAARRLTGSISPDPDGAGPLKYAAVRNTYDAAGRLIRVEKGELANWQAETVAPAAWTGYTVFSQVDTSYDALGRKLTEKNSSAGVAYTLTQYSYDSIGRLDCTTVRMNPAAFATLPASACTLGTQGSSGPDRITKNNYDAAGQLLKVQKALGTSLQQDYATYTYSLDGKQTSVTDANGNKASITYDGFDRRSAWNFPSPTTVGQVSTTDYESYGYDANGNRTSLRKRDNSTLTYSYDAMDRMTLKSVPARTGTPPSATRSVYYGYDLRGLQLYARFDSASGADGVTNAYDGFGHLATSTTAMSGTSRMLTYQYDADGNRLQITHPDSVYFTANYDGLDRLVQTFSSATSIIDPRLKSQLDLMAYDSAGRRSSRFEGAQVYGYDGVDRLTSSGIKFGCCTTPFDGTWTLGYNPASQIVSQSRSNDSYVWTGGVNLTRNYAVNGLNQYKTAGPATFTYDANGNLTSDGTTTYGYDVENRLISSSAGASLIYDPLGRLWQTSGGAAGTTQFLYDGDALVAEYNSAGTVLRRYVHGTGADEPLVAYEGASIAPSSEHFLMADHQGSIVLAYDRTLTQQIRNSYDEYGIPGTGNSGRFQYTGQIWIPELGMYYYKARIYSPTLGRFMQTDPIGYQDQINLYTYVGNDPINGRDPKGESAEDVANIVIGTAKIVTGTLGAAVGTAIVAGSGVVEVGTVGLATPGAVPAAIGGAIVITASVVETSNGAAQFSAGVQGLISENRANRGGQGQGERGETRNPDKGEKHTKPDPTNPGNTIVNRPGSKPYSRPARSGEPGHVDKSAPPVPTVPRGKKKNDQ